MVRLKLKYVLKLYEYFKEKCLAADEAFGGEKNSWKQSSWIKVRQLLWRIDRKERRMKWVQISVQSILSASSNSTSSFYLFLSIHIPFTLNWRRSTQHCFIQMHLFKNGKMAMLKTNSHILNTFSNHTISFSYFIFAYTSMQLKQYVILVLFLSVICFHCGSYSIQIIIEV